MRMLVYLYPRAWRNRYGAEFLELLEGQPATPRAIVDVALGALDAHAHLRPRAGRVAHAAGAPTPTVAGLLTNLSMGVTLIHAEVALRLAARYDDSLGEHLREVRAASAARGPFLIPKWLCHDPAPGVAAREIGRAPIVTTGIRRPIAPA